MIPETSVSIDTAVIAIFITALIVFFERFFPFLLFSKKEPPETIRFIERFIPPMAIAALLVYCLKDIEFSSPAKILPSAISLVVCIGLHVWKRNSLISIFGSTLLYMALIKI